jgi:hypothetical protein
MRLKILAKKKRMMLGVLKTYTLSEVNLKKQALLLRKCLEKN